MTMKEYNTYFLQFIKFIITSLKVFKIVNIFITYKYYIQYIERLEICELGFWRSNSRSRIKFLTNLVHPVTNVRTSLKAQRKRSESSDRDLSRSVSFSRWFNYYAAAAIRIYFRTFHLARLACFRPVFPTIRRRDTRPE